MATTTAFAGDQLQPTDAAFTHHELYESLSLLVDWLKRHDYKGYDTFDGLNARLLRPLTFETRLLRTVLQQGVRRCPFNLRPLVGVRPSHSTKGMGFIARGFSRLHKATGDPEWLRLAEAKLDWLLENRAVGYRGACWGNHFDYQSRAFYLPKGIPTVVWTSLIGHAFLDGYRVHERSVISRWLSAPASIS